MHFRKTALCVLICFFAATATAASEEVSRGKALGELMRVLDLPLKQGKSFSDVDRTTPYGLAIESALSLGVLDPADSFSPEIECSHAEILMFALSAMGLHHESELARWALPPEDEKLPENVSGYLALAKSVKPTAPTSVTDTPWDSTTDSELEEILHWAELCRDGIAWDCEIERPEGTLHIRRENVGRPPRGWRVQLGVYDTEDAAQAALKKTKSNGVPLVVIQVDDDYAYAVATPIVSSHKAAWMMAKKLGKKNYNQIILPESGESEALFWASFTPVHAGDAEICMNGSLDLKSMDKLSNIAEASGALVAINGGYFRNGAPIGALHVDSFPVTPPYYNRSMVAWDYEDHTFFGGGEYLFRLSINGGDAKTVQLNGVPNYGETSVITPPLGKSSIRAGNNGTVARVKGNEIVEVLPALQYRTDMKDDEWLIVSRDPEFAVKEGDKAEIQTQFREDLPFTPINAVQAGPLLYAPGHQFWDEKFSASILKMRHPRTLIGWTGEKIVWIVADGRSSWHSRGLTLEEATALGHRLGFVALLNLDGGGSSEMWWDGHIVNSVSDGHERSLPYALAVMPAEPEEEVPEEPQILTRKEKKHNARVARKAKKHNARLIRKIKRQAEQMSDDEIADE